MCVALKKDALDKKERKAQAKKDRPAASAGQESADGEHEGGDESMAVDEGEGEGEGEEEREVAMDAEPTGADQP